ncbi:MAG: hypothetical protein GW789_04010, partial [Ignavibacteria bacterium]|nr:hypothetical protein [Ignavibacteria bacterium]
ERKRYIEVGQEFNKNISVESIAETMGVKRGTIIKHLFDYVLNGNKLNPDYLQSEVKLGKELQKNILNEFKLEGTSALSPLKEKFGDAVTYDDLHLLRIIFLNKSK